LRYERKLQEAYYGLIRDFEKGMGLLGNACKNLAESLNAFSSEMPKLEKNEITKKTA